MKKKDHSKYFLIFFFVALIAFSFIVKNDVGSPTGTTTHIQFEEKPTRYAKTLENWVDDFFHIDTIVFPKGVCSDIAKELLEQNLKKSPAVTEDFSTNGPQRVCSLMFGIEQEFLGALEMIYGPSLLEKEGVNSAMNLWIESVVRLPKLSRASQIEVTLYGNTRDKFYVARGDFSTPVLKCHFHALPDGTSDCTCEAGRHYEYINE